VNPFFENAILQLEIKNTNRLLNGDFENLHSEQYRNLFHWTQEGMACLMKFSDHMIVSGLIIMKSDPGIRGLFLDFL
jgi:hypothetical protein